MSHTLTIPTAWRPYRSHYENSIYFCARCRPRDTDAVSPMSGTGQRRGVLTAQLKAHTDRLDDMENRLQRVEYLQEQTEAYRFLRAEHATKLSDVWDRFQQKTIDGRQFKAEATLALAADIRDSMLVT